MNQSKTRPVTVGGRVQPESNIPAEWLEAIAATMFHIGAKCKRAHQALRDRASTDADFMTDEEIRDKLDMMHQRYLEARGELLNQLTEHRGHRAIHLTRKKVKLQLEALRAAEAKFLKE